MTCDAIRSLRRAPGLTAFVVITLALGIGITSQSRQPYKAAASVSN